MKSLKSVIGKAALVTLAVLGFAGAAQAGGNVYWSVGVGSPGVSVGVSNARPVYVQPAPVYYQPAPVYYQQPQTYYQPQPVYVQPAPVYYGRPYGHRKHHRHGHNRHQAYVHGGHYYGH